jgi:hypothetical protein
MGRNDPKGSKRKKIQNFLVSSETSVHCVELEKKNPTQLEQAQPEFVCEGYRIMKFNINNKKSTRQRTRGRVTWHVWIVRMMTW